MRQQVTKSSREVAGVHCTVAVCSANVCVPTWQSLEGAAEKTAAEGGRDKLDFGLEAREVVEFAGDDAVAVGDEREQQREL